MIGRLMWAIAVTALWGQTASGATTYPDPAENSAPHDLQPASDEGRSDPADQDSDDRRAVLLKALADYDAAVAAKARSAPEAQRLYHQALEGFESLLRDGISNGRLYYDVGNTYLRLGDVGRAIVNYRRGLRLMPGDEAIRRNLQVARNACELQVPEPATSDVVRTLLFWHFDTSLKSRLDGALAGYIGFWLLLLVRRFILRRSPAYGWTIRVVAAVVLVAWASVAWDMTMQRHRVEGVLVADKAVIRKGNGEYYDPQLEQPLSAGVEFLVLETRSDVEGASWYRVQLRNGTEGWLRADQGDII